MTRAFILYMNLPELLPKCLAYACVCNAVCVCLSSVYGTIESIFIALSTQLSFTQQLLFLLIFDGQQTYKHTIYAVSYVNLLWSKLPQNRKHNIYRGRVRERVSQREWTLINVNAIRNVNAITASCNERRSQCKNLKGTHKRSVTSRDTERAWVGERKFASATQ